MFRRCLSILFMQLHNGILPLCNFDAYLPKIYFTSDIVPNNNYPIHIWFLFTFVVFVLRLIIDVLLLLFSVFPISNDGSIIRFLYRIRHCLCHWWVYTIDKSILHCYWQILIFQGWSTKFSLLSFVQPSDIIKRLHSSVMTTEFSMQEYSVCEISFG